jgi:hypothetical protein
MTSAVLKDMGLLPLHREILGGRVLYEPGRWVTDNNDFSLVRWRNAPQGPRIWGIFARSESARQVLSAQDMAGAVFGSRREALRSLGAALHIARR